MKRIVFFLSRDLWFLATFTTSFTSPMPEDAADSWTNFDPPFSRADLAMIRAKVV